MMSDWPDLVAVYFEGLGGRCSILAFVFGWAFSGEAYQCAFFIFEARRVGGSPVDGAAGLGHERLNFLAGLCEGCACCEHGYVS